MDEESFAFGSFRLIPAQRVLLEDGKPLRLGSRALDILITLVENAGETIQKEQLIARTWPDTVVDEGALRVHVAALRKALGDGRAGIRYIANVPGRGYSFVAPIAREQRQPATSPPDQAAVAGNLPAPLTRILGRDDVIAALATQLSQRRFLTIVGPGGVGKTTVAIAIAQTASAAYKDGVWSVALSSLADPDLVPSAITAVLGISQSGVNPVSGLTAWLRDKHALIVLDSCEHVVAAAAKVAEEILRAARRVSILITSREPLRGEGEWVYRLASLQVPPVSAELATDNVLRFPAVELFTERAAAIVEGLSFGSGELSAVVEICRRLDGMPLALELAAAQVDIFGVRGLAARLDDRFTILTKGRRTALPRHQTLRATMDWSYDLLPQAEQLILGRLSVFQSDFTMAAAAAVAADDQIKIADVFEGVANLAMKSLVTTDISGELTYHRLLDTTRAYALGKLPGSGEVDRVRKLHAEYYRDLFERAEAEWEARPPGQLLADYGRQIDNVRAALDWAFSPGGDTATGVALTVATVPLWTHLSLMEECRYRAGQALASVGNRSDADKRREMQLYAALGAALMYTRGATPETRAAFARALEIADVFDDDDYRLRALWGLWVDRMNDGAVRDAMGLAERFSISASSSADPIALPIVERTMGFALHFVGDQANARRHLERMFSRSVPALHNRPIIRFQFDPWLTARMRLAVILWLQGYPDQATRTVESGIDDALSINHAVTLCNAFAQGACPIALMSGDLEAAERSVTMLFDHAERSGLRFWQADARCFEGVLLMRRGDLAQGLDILRNALGEYSSARSHTRYDAFLGELAEALGGLGEVPQGLTVLDGALDRTERTGGRWYVAELLRIKGELLLLQGAPGAAGAAEDHFRQALAWAKRQGALSWELRAATSLARLLHSEHRVADARDVLGSVYGHFTEGFATSDLRAAKSLLAELA
jgi:predicted ATPase/DNA-binding winged helix-turn-helix (wHTH) protein